MYRIYKQNVEKESGSTTPFSYLCMDNLEQLSQYVINGNMFVECTSNARIVRIFTSSTFTDTQVERNTLMERVYPKLKEYCQQRGFEFQVVDMRWGVRDEMVDDHKTTELCMKELELCKKVSTGPNFVTFLSHKYGYRPIPRVIPATEFDQLLRHIPEDKLYLYSKWYRKDYNSVPPSYVMQPISTHLPDFNNDEDQKKKRAAKADFWKDSDILQHWLILAAKVCLKEERRRNAYLVAVTENEIIEGIDTENPESECVWFRRNFVDIEEQDINDPIVPRFYECKGGTDEEIRETRELLKELRDRKIPAVIPPQNILSYDINWNPKGINIADEPQHAAYIDTLCEDFESKLCSLIDGGIARRALTDIDNPLYQEIATHTTFAQEKFRFFCGRKDILQLAKDYISGNINVGAPLILNGLSGAGKTSTMAMVAREASYSFGNQCILVLRFLGTTQQSSNLLDLLTSINYQISFAYGIPSSEKMAKSRNIKVQIALFKMLVKTKHPDRPLLILLDSLDQLDPEYGARDCSWVPTVFGPSVRLILSTLPEEKYEVLPMLKANFKEHPDAFLELPLLPNNEAEQILKLWFKSSKRILTRKQEKALLSVYKQCQLPLHLKLCFETAKEWKSYTERSQFRLDPSVRGMIELLFETLERKHGRLFTRHTLGFLTLSPGGLTEAELEETLCIDDEVLNDTYQFWKPPVRRLPPLLLSRLLGDLQEYIVERGVHGARTLYWYHRQFIEAAQARYCSDETENKKLYSLLADYYRGIWATESKPFVDTSAKGSGKADTALRYVPAQPVLFTYTENHQETTRFNMRKLSQLPHMLIGAGSFEILQDECLLNYDFLRVSICGLGVASTLAVFREACEAAGGASNDLVIVQEALQLAQDALQFAPEQLAGQLVGRLGVGAGCDETDTAVGRLLDACRKSSTTVVIPSEGVLVQPGGQLLHTLAGHEKEITHCAVDKGSTFAVTASEDKTVRVWDIVKGAQIRVIRGVGCEYSCQIVLVNEDKHLVVNTDKAVRVYEVATGAHIHDIPNQKAVNGKAFICPHILAIENGRKIVIVAKLTVNIISTDNWQVVAEIVDDMVPNLDRVEQGNDDYYTKDVPMDAHNNYIVLCEPQFEKHIKLVDLRSKKFSAKLRLFDRPKNDDDDDVVISDLVLLHSEKYALVAEYMKNTWTVVRMADFTILASFRGDKAHHPEKSRVMLDDSALLHAQAGFVIRWDLKKLRFDDEEMLKKMMLESAQRPFWEAICEGASNGVDVNMVAPVNAHCVVTGSADFCFKIWDLRRKKKKTESSFYNYNCLENELIWLDDSCRYLFSNTKIQTNKTGKRVIEKFLFEVHDVKELRVIRECSFNVTTRVAVYKYDSKHILVEFERKLHLLNVDSMSFVTEFEGFLDKFAAIAHPCAARQEIYASSRSTKGIKVYDAKSGKVKKVFDNLVTSKEKDSCLDDFKTVPDGSAGLIIFDSDKLKQIDIIDLDTFKSVGKITSPGMDGFFLQDGLFALENSLLVQQVTMKVGKSSVCAAAVFRLRGEDGQPAGHKLHNLVDTEAQSVLSRAKSDLCVDISSFVVMNDKWYITGCDDKVTRIWDVLSGNLLKKFEGMHAGGVDLLSVLPRPASSTHHFLSGCTMDDRSFRMYHCSPEQPPEQWKSVVCFRLDSDFQYVKLLNDGNCIAHRQEDYLSMIRWDRQPALDLPEYPPESAIFSSVEDTSSELTLPSIDPVPPPEEGDLDQSCDPVSDNDDDDDDDDDDYIDSDDERFANFD